MRIFLQFKDPLSKCVTFWWQEDTIFYSGGMELSEQIIEESSLETCQVELQFSFSIELNRG